MSVVALSDSSIAAPVHTHVCAAWFPCLFCTERTFPIVCPLVLPVEASPTEKLLQRVLRIVVVSWETRDEEDNPIVMAQR